MTYNLYPHSNYTLLTMDIILIVYFIIKKILVQRRRFILCQMLVYTSDPPYVSLICHYLDEVLPKKLADLNYANGRVGYTINETTIARMGLPYHSATKDKCWSLSSTTKWRCTNNRASYLLGPTQ